MDANTKKFGLVYGCTKKSGFGLGANECGVEDIPDVRLGR